MIWIYDDAHGLPNSVIEDYLKAKEEITNYLEFNVFTTQVMFRMTPLIGDFREKNEDGRMIKSLRFEFTVSTPFTLERYTYDKYDRLVHTSSELDRFSVLTREKVMNAIDKAMRKYHLV